MSKRSDLVEFVCPECGAAIDVIAGTRRKRCPDCQERRNRERARERAKEMSKVWGYATMRREPPSVTVEEVLRYGRAHGIASYGKAVLAMEAKK